jgi:hypothetical protein
LLLFLNVLIFPIPADGFVAKLRCKQPSNEVDPYLLLREQTEQGNRLLGDSQLGRRSTLRPYAHCVPSFCVPPLVVKTGEKEREKREREFYFGIASAIGVFF